MTKLLVAVHLRYLIFVSVRTRFLLLMSEDPYSLLCVLIYDNISETRLYCSWPKIPDIRFCKQKRSHTLVCTAEPPHWSSAKSNNKKMIVQNVFLFWLFAMKKILKSMFWFVKYKCTVHMYLHIKLVYNGDTYKDNLFLNYRELLLECIIIHMK